MKKRAIISQTELDSLLRSHLEKKTDVTPLVFDNVILSRVRLPPGSLVRNIHITDSVIEESDFSRTSLPGFKMSNTLVTSTKFSHAYLADAHLLGVKATEVNFTGANLTRAVIKSLQLLQNSSISRVNALKSLLTDVIHDGTLNIKHAELPYRTLFLSDHVVWCGDTLAVGELQLPLGTWDKMPGEQLQTIFWSSGLGEWHFIRKTIEALKNLKKTYESVSGGRY